MAARRTGYRRVVDPRALDPLDPAADAVAARLGSGDLLIAVSGDVDMRTAPEIEHRMVDLIAAEGVDDVVIDLSRVEFFDSAGVRALIVAQREAGARDMRLKVSAASPRCRRVLEISGLDQLLGLR
jgi:anti-sigma B factor antagonist